MINIYSQSGQVTYGIIYYTVDTENEKNSLPTKDKMGSKCYVIESETWYILNGNREWVPFVGEDSTADAILISIKNMSAEQKDQLKEELDIEGGGSVTVDTTLSTTSENPVQNKAIAAALNELHGSMDALVEMLDVSKQDKPTVITVSGATPTIAPVDNTIYSCGELTSLTISNPPATGKYSIVFFSGAAPTTTVGIENFAAEANKRYKITVEDNYATYDSWPYMST